MNKIGKLFIFCCLLSFVSGCTLIESVNDIYNKDVKAQKYSYGDKSLIFVPIVHFGQEVFYNNLRDSVKHWKSDNYTVFYEEIGPKTKDKKTLELYNRKWRKISGGTGKSRADYGQLEEAFEGGIPQPEYDKLGIDSRDINADISFEQLIDKYEEIYGEVKLNDCDRSTPLKDTYSCGEGLKNDLSPIIVDYRNEHLAQSVIDSRIKKIVLIYGKDHMSGLQELLKQKKPLVSAN